MRLRTTERSVSPNVTHSVHKVEAAHPLAGSIKLFDLRNFNVLPSFVSFFRRIPKRWMVATLFVAIYRSMCAYQFTFINPGALNMFNVNSDNYQSSPNYSMWVFPEYGLATGWFAAPDIHEWPHIAFSLLVFLDTIAVTLVTWWLILKVPAFVWRKYPWRGRKFKH